MRITSSSTSCKKLNVYSVGTKHIIKYAPCLLYLFACCYHQPNAHSLEIILVVHPENNLIRIGCNSGRCMSRHFYFRNNGNITFSGIFHTSFICSCV